MTEAANSTLSFLTIAAGWSVSNSQYTIVLAGVIRALFQNLYCCGFSRFGSLLQLRIDFILGLGKQALREFGVTMVGRALRGEALRATGAPKG